MIGCMNATNGSLDILKNEIKLTFTIPESGNVAYGLMVSPSSSFSSVNKQNRKVRVTYDEFQP